MIIFYQKSTGLPFGVIEGRVHDKDVLEKSFIQHEDIPKKDIGKWVVPYVSNNKELIPNVKFRKLILDFESGKKGIYDYKLIIKDNKVEGFKLK